MSTAQRVTSPTFGPAATTRVANAGRNVATVSFQRVDDASGSNAMGPQEQSVRYDDGYRPPWQNDQQPDQRKPPFVPDFSSYAQVSHLDEVFASHDWSTPTFLLPTEIMQGVDRYETNMRVIAGVDRMGGASFNRLF